MSIRMVEGVVIMDFTGRFTVGESIVEFNEEFSRQLEKGMLKFVWNLRAFDYPQLNRATNCPSWPGGVARSAGVVVHEP